MSKVSLQTYPQYPFSSPEPPVPLSQQGQQLRGPGSSGDKNATISNLILSLPGLNMLIELRLGGGGGGLGKRSGYKFGCVTRTEELTAPQ